MRSNDIRVGYLYYGTRSEVLLVLDKGKYSTTTHSEDQRRINFKSLVFDVGRSWYFPNGQEKSTIAVANLNSSYVETVTGARIRRPLSAEQVRDFLIDTKRTSLQRDRISALHDQKRAFRNALAHFYVDITKTSEGLTYSEENQPLAILLRKPDFVHQLISLWLSYEKIQGRAVGASHSNPEDLLADLMDMMNGIKTVETKIKTLNEDVIAQAMAELSQHLDDPVKVEVVS